VKRCLRLTVAVREKEEQEKNEKERSYMQEEFENKLQRVRERNRILEGKSGMCMDSWETKG
jgi:hypothetical protein